ncbi:MAG: hypothetical protein ACI9VR_002058 [Cognaticolwellia sp.]|jgi:hypothetical protein
MLTLILGMTSLTSCAPDPENRPRAAAPDGFGNQSSARLISPEQGQSIRNPISVRFSTGEDIDSVRLWVDGRPVSGTVSVDVSRLNVELENGRQELVLEGYASDGSLLSSDEVFIKVLEDEPASWVSIRSPLDGAQVVNPVTFVIDASSDTSTVILSADDWPLGDVVPGQVLTYRFDGTDTVRQIRADSFDAEGALLSSESISITPLSGSNGGPTAFSERVADTISSYPQDGSYSYYWPQGGSWSGSTQNLYYQGEQVADDGGYSACYCSGITWEWYLVTWQQLAQEQALDPDSLGQLDTADIWTMRRDWYVRDLDGDGPGAALKDRGIGDLVGDWDQVVRGDFVQFWRTSGSGHTAVFWDWETDGSGNRTGIQYASCQGASDGLGLNSEFFGTKSGAIDPSLVYFGRAWMPEDWQ